MKRNQTSSESITQLPDGETRMGLAKQFYDELSDSVEVFSEIVAQHGARTLADLFHLHASIMGNGFIDAWPDSQVLKVVAQLPSAERWLEYVSVYGEHELEKQSVFSKTRHAAVLPERDHDNAGEGLTPEQLEALDAFRTRNGRNWKSALRANWERARYPNMTPDHAAALQRVRNTLGPEWLSKFQPLNLVVDGLDEAANFAGDGARPPFVIFNVDLQQHVAGPFPSRELAEHHRLEVLSGQPPRLDAPTLAEMLTQIDEGVAPTFKLGDRHQAIRGEAAHEATTATPPNGEDNDHLQRVKDRLAQGGDDPKWLDQMIQTLRAQKVASLDDVEIDRAFGSVALARFCTQYVKAARAHGLTVDDVYLAARSAQEVGTPENALPKAEGYLGEEPGALANVALAEQRLQPLTDHDGNELKAGSDSPEP